VIINCNSIIYDKYVSHIKWKCSVQSTISHRSILKRYTTEVLKCSSIKNFVMPLCSHSKRHLTHLHILCFCQKNTQVQTEPQPRDGSIFLYKFVYVKGVPWFKQTTKFNQLYLQFSFKITHYNYLCMELFTAHQINNKPFGSLLMCQLIKLP
jgi:hypothetical protein